MPRTTVNISEAVATLSILYAAPYNYLVLLPDAPRFTIVAVTDAYLKATSNRREVILGKGLFEVFPHNPALPNTAGVHNLNASLQYVIQHKCEHRMADQHYDAIDTKEGAFNVWRQLNKPVLDSNGDVQFIIHCVENITEHKKIEQQVKENRELLQTAINVSLTSFDVCKAIRNEHGQITDFEFILSNNKFQPSGVDLTGKRYAEVFPGIKQSGVFEKFVLATEGISQDFEVNYTHEGFDHWFRIVAVKLGDGFLNTGEDITVRKKAEQEVLRLSNELAQRATDKYLSLFNSIDEGFVISELLYDDKGKAVDLQVLEANPRFNELMQVTSPVGRRAREIFPNVEDNWFEMYHQVIFTGKAVRFENYLGTLDRWFELYISRVGEKGSRIFAIVFRDVTELKQAAEALRQSEEQLKVLNANLEQQVGERTRALREINAQLAAEQHFLEEVTDKTPLLIYVYDLEEQRFTYINKRVSQFIGRDQDYIIAMGPHLFQAILHPDDVPVRASYISSLASLQYGEVRENEFRIWTGAAFRWFRSRDSIFLKDEQTVRQVIGIAEDITYEKIVQDQAKKGKVHIGLN
jgi:PAS domain S-box-containing protein